MAECLQMSLADSTCQMAWMDEDEEGNITSWDSENYNCDPVTGECNVSGDECPGDYCEGFQANFGDEYCDRCGELLEDCGHGDDDSETCEYCGEALGFCAEDCESWEE